MLAGDTLIYDILSKFSVCVSRCTQATDVSSGFPHTLTVDALLNSSSTERV